MNPTDGGVGRPSKVARLIDQYGLNGFGAELERRWTADDPDERSSLRDLARLVNRRVLREHLQTAGEQPLDGEVENLYRLLTDDAVGGADRTRAERRLERHDIDVDDLRSEFVSYQAVRTYLTHHRGAEYAEADERPATVADHVRRLRSRTASVTRSKIDGLERSDHLDIGDVRVTVDVRVICEDCGAQYDFDTLIDRRQCECP